MANDGVANADSEKEGVAGPLARVTVAEQADFKITSANPTEQQSLFSPGELQAPKGLKQYRKGIAALHSIPVNRAHTLNSRRVMDAIVALVQLDFKKRPKHQVEQLRAMEASPLFKVSKGELRKMAGIASKSFGRVEAVLELLGDMKVTWNVMGEDTQVEWKMNSRFLASWGIGQGPNEHLVCFSIDPRMLDLVLEPRLWVTLNLEVQHQLTTESSYALYQNAWRYIGTASKVTADFPVATWIELIMGPSRYVQTDEATGNKRVVDYSEWKKRHLLPAMERVNSLAALGHTLELVETKSGLKVRRIQFKFVPKRQEALELPITWPDPVVDALKGLGFSSGEVADLAQGFSLDEVVESMTRYRQAAERMRERNQRISSPKAFYNGILTNVTQQDGLDEDQLLAIETKARTEEAQRQAAERQERAQQAFSQRQTKRLASALDEWTPERRAELLGAFESSPDAAKAKLLLAKGWDSSTSTGAWALLKAWIMRERPSLLVELLPNPEDQSMEAWVLWRMEQRDTV